MCESCGLQHGAGAAALRALEGGSWCTSCAPLPESHAHHDAHHDAHALHHLAAAGHHWRGRGVAARRPAQAAQVIDLTAEEPPPAAALPPLASKQPNGANPGAGAPTGGTYDRQQLVGSRAAAQLAAAQAQLAGSDARPRSGGECWGGGLHAPAECPPGWRRSAPATVGGGWAGDPTTLALIVSAVPAANDAPGGNARSSGGHARDGASPPNTTGHSHVLGASATKLGRPATKKRPASAASDQPGPPLAWLRTMDKLVHRSKNCEGCGLKPARFGPARSGEIRWCGGCVPAVCTAGHMVEKRGQARVASNKPKNNKRMSAQQAASKKRSCESGHAAQCPFCGCNEDTPNTVVSATDSGEEADEIGADGEPILQRRRMRKMKAPRQSRKMGVWWRKYGYSGERYCQRCSEVFRDHIIRGFSNSCDCSRDSPCQDCTKILAHFPMSREQLFASMDRGVKPPSKLMADMQAARKAPVGRRDLCGTHLLQAGKAKKRSSSGERPKMCDGSKEEVKRAQAVAAQNKNEKDVERRDRGEERKVRMRMAQAVLEKVKQKRLLEVQARERAQSSVRAALGAVGPFGDDEQWVVGEQLLEIKDEEPHCVRPDGRLGHGGSTPPGAPTPAEWV